MHENISGPIIFEIVCYISFLAQSLNSEESLQKLNNSRIQIRIQIFTKIEYILPCQTPNMSTKFCPKSRRGIASNTAKFQIPAPTSRGHSISSTATPSANDATPQPYAVHEQRILSPFWLDLTLPTLPLLISLVLPSVIDRIDVYHLAQLSQSVWAGGRAQGGKS